MFPLPYAFCMADVIRDLYLKNQLMKTREVIIYIFNDRMQNEPFRNVKFEDTNWKL